VHNPDVLPKRNDRLNSAIGFFDIAQRFQGDRLGLRWSDLLGPCIRGAKKDIRFCFLGVEDMPRAFGLKLKPPPFRWG
jgi:hypothetical protein